jgi:phytoene synthase
MFAPAHARGALEALYAFEAELADTVHASSHEVAHTRLQWWRSEVDRLLGGAPQHPVTRALLPLREIAGADLALLHEPFVAADIDLARMTFQDGRELEAYCFRAAGALQTLAAMASRGDAQLGEAERGFARRLGSAVRRTELLRDLRGHVAAGRLPLPLDVLERAGIDPHGVRPDTMTPALANLLRDLRDKLRREVTELPGALDRNERSQQRQGLVLAALHARLLDQVAHDRELARAQAVVPPWTRLWTAWRTAVRSA